MGNLRWRSWLEMLGACGLACAFVACDGSVESASQRATDESTPEPGAGGGSQADRDAGSVRDDGGTDPANDDATDAGGTIGASDGGNPDGIALRFFSVINQEVDSRFAELPSTLPMVRLLPGITLQADVAASVGSVRFTVDGKTRLDTSAPFRFSEDDKGAATAWPATLGDHTILLETYAASDASGAALATENHTLALTAQGSDATPAAGEHSVNRLWVTSTGEYVHKNAGGDFVNPAGSVVLKAADVSVDDRGNGQLYLVSKAGLPTLDFAFIVLLPDGFDESVAYPLVLLLHHGSEDYRGTDSDASLLAQQPLAGERSIVKSALRHQFPAIILIPQLHFHAAISGVNHEWAAFTSIDGTKGNSKSAKDPSVGARYALDILDDLIAAILPIDGKHTTIDATRLYMTGHSMGGLGTWDLVARQPNFWAAAVPMAGYPDHDKAAALVNTPIWAFHHRIDCYNAFAGSETMNRLITETNGGKRMRLSALTFDTGGKCDQAHFQTPDRAFADTNLLPWMFSQVNDRGANK